MNDVYIGNFVIPNLYVSREPLQPALSPLILPGSRLFRQAFLSAQIFIIMFDALAVPNLTPRVGIRAHQRVGAALQVLT